MADRPTWAVDSHTGEVLTGAPGAPLRLILPDGPARPTTAEPRFAFSPGGSLFALQSEPPAIRIAGTPERVINLPASTRDSTINNSQIWESKQHLLLPLTGRSDALRVDTQTGECETATMPDGVLAQPLITEH